MVDTPRPTISNLAQLTEAASKSGTAPVEHWNPPYCGDIGLAILADGTWTYRGSPIRREALVKLFARVLRRDEDGRHYLVTPAEKVDVAVADAPFIAVEVDLEGNGADQRLTFRTHLDDLVACGPERPLRFEVEPATGGFKPYVRVRGRLEALLSRALAVEIAGLACPFDETQPERLGIWSGGMWFELAPGSPAQCGPST